MVPLRSELCIWLHKVTFYLLVGDSYVYFLLLLSVFCLGPNEICITFFFSFLSVFDITVLVISFVFTTFYKKEILTSRSDKTNR